MRLARLSAGKVRAEAGPGLWPPKAREGRLRHRGGLLFGAVSTVFSYVVVVLVLLGGKTCLLFSVKCVEDDSVQLCLLGQPRSKRWRPQAVLSGPLAQAQLPVSVPVGALHQGRALLCDAGRRCWEG